MDRIVTVDMMCVELKRISMTDASVFVLRKRVYRWLKNESIVHRRVTHLAHNTRHDKNVINSFAEYVNSQIATGQYSTSNVVNIHKTNIYFVMTGAITLANRGSRTIGVRTSVSASRCTVLLGVTMSGEKLPLFLVFKGKPIGRLAREWTGAAEFQNSSVYALQEKA